MGTSTHANDGPSPPSSPVPSSFYDLLNEAHESNTLRSIRKTWSPATQSPRTFSPQPTSAPPPEILADRLSAANRKLNSKQSKQQMPKGKTCGVSAASSINTSSRTTA